MVNDIGKMIALLTIVVIVAALLWAGRIEEVAAVGVISGIVGYFTGNGVNVVRRNAPSPALVARPSDDMLEDAAVHQVAVQLLEQAAAVQASRQGWPDYRPPPPPPPPGPTLADPWERRRG